MLKKEYKPEMSLQDGIKFGVKSLMAFLGKDFHLDRIDGVYITVIDKKFTRLKRSDIEKYSDENKKNQKKH